MTSWQYAIAHATKVLVILVLVGVFARRRQRLCWPFVAYLAAILTCNSLITFWPERFFNEGFWIVKESLYAVLRVGIALDLAYRAFRAFPGARATARAVLLTILTLTTAAIVAVPRPHAYTTMLAEWQPRMLSGTIWLLTATALLIVWYRIPIHRFQHAVMLGFVVYLVVFTTLINVLRSRGWDLRQQLGGLDALAYTAVVGWWAYAAWRPEEQIDVAPEILRRLQMEHA